MPTEERYLEEIARDFIRQWLESAGFYTILVVIDQFIKVQYYILATTTWLEVNVAHAYITEIRRLYGHLRDITLHRGLQFAFKFLKELNWKFNIFLHFVMPNYA